MERYALRALRLVGMLSSFSLVTACASGGSSGNDGATGGNDSGIVAPTCSDGTQNGGETDVDCGGPGCTACGVGSSCRSPDDCQTGFCDPATSTCRAVACDDGVANGNESDVDCGGSCDSCANNRSCNEADDCVSGICDSSSGLCVAITCTDSALNGTETDVDCGGPDCAPCADDAACVEGTDCQSGVCDDSTCNAPTCDDTVANGDETATDCGGGTCDPCADNVGCLVATDCMSGVCNETTHTCSPPACDDEVLNGEETAMDCGGSDCDPCVDEVACTTGTDCASGVCDDVTNTCVAPSCDDDVTNGAETDTDCGGGECDLCADNLDCTTDTDCHSGVCDTDLGTCSPPACDDEVMNGEETDVDCGGRICAACPVVGESCSRDNCAEGYCRWGTCEIGIDCLDVMENLGETEDGLYTIDPDGAAGAVAPFEAYCDMTSEGGGWTAVMRAYDNNFAYGDVVWTTAALFNETDYEFETAGLAKYEAFNSVPVFTLRTTDADDFSVGHEYNFEDQQLGALAVFSSTGFEIGTELIHYFNDRVPAGAQQWGCETYITYGFNQADYIGAGWTGGGGYCDWNGGARWGQRVNANHGGTGNHAGQGWGAFSLISVGSYTSPTGGFALQQVLWVRRAAHCADGTLSDGETDVDCGDECGTCPRGGTCVDDNDCAIGYCLDEVCTVPASCADMLAARDTATDGVYKVDFDGDDSELPADVFCDMTRDGGGWTLVGKVAAGDYTSMTDEDYINLVANPVDDVNPDLLQASTYPTAGQMAFLNRAKMNAMFAGSSVQTVRVDMTNNLVNGAANGTYYQARLDPPEDWDFWGAIRSSYLWSDETYTGGSSCTHDDGSVTQCYLGGAGETFILNKGDVYDADTDSFDNNTDGSFGWWSDENLTLVDGSTLLVTRHGGLMCDGFGNMGWQWLLTLDAGGDSRWKADTHRAQSLIWFK